MSIEVMRYVWKNSKSKANNRLMLLAIADIANDPGDAYPGVDRLAEKCNMAHKSAQEAIKELERAGELKVFENVGTRTKSGWTNLYRVVMEGVDQSEVRAPDGEIAVARPVTDKKHRSFPKGVLPVTPLSDSQAVSTDTPLENEGVKPVTPHGVLPVTPKALDYPSDSNTKAGNKESPIPPNEKISGKKPDAVKQAENHLEEVDPLEDSRIAENQAKNLIRSYLNLTQSVDTAMLNHSERKAEALRLLDKDITPAHMQIYLKRHKTETGYWKDKNVPWKVLIGDIVSHFQLRSLESSLTTQAPATVTTYDFDDDETPYEFVMPTPPPKRDRFMENMLAQEAEL